MSKQQTIDDAGESTDGQGLPIDRRGFMKAGAASAVAAGLGVGLSSLTTADDSRDELVEHTGDWIPTTCAGCTS
ncbi:MAG: twin-arginine translocation signal domain-containing protein, partial [Halovenus sp.]